LKKKSVRKSNQLKLGIALGSGAARGFIHLGVLKVLHENDIFPDYIAGTSMGALIGAAYAAGFSPRDITIIANKTDWKNSLDFVLPRSGILKGELFEKKVRHLIKKKKFSDLEIPLRVVAYNLTKNEKVVFCQGDVAQAVRASSSIPGIFSPAQIGRDKYVDGVLADPTPFDVVKDMGADVVIAVDLYNHDKTIKKKKVSQSNLYQEFKHKFIIKELFNVKNYLFPKRWPGFLRKTFNWLFDKILYPTKVLRIMAGRELPEIAKVVYDSMNILSNNFANERIEHADIDIKLRPKFGHLKWNDFDKVNAFVKIGEKAMRKQLPELKKKLKIK
jgi:predicted acylesterase/phospholipase RssA